MIIGLSGYAQSGKDTVADYLVKNHGYTRVAFADGVRDFLYEINPRLWINIDTLTSIKYLVDSRGWDEAKKIEEVRRLLQNVGVGARKQFGDLIWVNMVLNKINFTGNYVITDVRFKNEAAFIKKRDYATIWRVDRPGVGPVNDHVSEIEMDDWDFDCRFINDGSIESLEFQVKIRLSQDV
jgi:hypothetical protein